MAPVLPHLCFLRKRENHYWLPNRIQNFSAKYVLVDSCRKWKPLHVPFLPADLLQRESAEDQRDLSQKCKMLRIQTIICTLSVLSLAAKADLKTRNCSEVRDACVVKGFSFAHVPLQEISGKDGI